MRAQLNSLTVLHNGEKCSGDHYSSLCQRDQQHRGLVCVFYVTWFSLPATTVYFEVQVSHWLYIAARCSLHVVEYTVSSVAVLVSHNELLAQLGDRQFFFCVIMDLT